MTSFLLSHFAEAAYQSGILQCGSRDHSIPVKLGAYALASSAVTRIAYLASVKSNEISVIDVNATTAFYLPVGAVSGAQAVIAGSGTNPAGTVAYVVNGNARNVLSTINVGNGPVGVTAAR